MVSRVSKVRVSVRSRIMVRFVFSARLGMTIHRVTVTPFLHISCFPPFCGANSAKCLLF